jgi:hypothetical protein
MRFRVRGIMKGSNVPVLHKIDGADNPYDAAAQAAKILRSEGHDPASMESVSVKPMKESKVRGTYFGKPTTGRKGPIGRTVPAAAPAAAPAVPAPAAAPAPTTAAKMAEPAKPAATKAK